MGRKRQSLAGLSRFVSEAFGQPTTGGGQTREDVPEASPASTSRRVSQRDPADLEVTGTEVAATKKRKIGLLGPGHGQYDATGLVPFYTELSEVPEHLQKYFFQRERYFSLYSSGCLLDEEGWYSVTPELIATQIAERCRCDTILDAFCGVGGNAIAFAQTCERVIAIDTSPTRLALARHNAIIYGVEHRIEFILGDYLAFSRAYLSLPNSDARKIDVVFLSPPWGGPDYLAGDTTNNSQDRTTAQGSTDTHPEFTLAQIKPVHGAELFNLTRKITKNVAYFLPRNTNLREVSSLLDDDNRSKNGKQKPENVEVEEEWMGPKLKALTCYFGGLVPGQEQLFEA